MRLQLPQIEGIIRRRLLVNFRVEPEVIQRQLPARFRPKLHAGSAVAGVCLIRLEEIRPAGFPGLLGVSSENAAHRIAVVWEENGEPREGVYIPRRDSGSVTIGWPGAGSFPVSMGPLAFRFRIPGSLWICAWSRVTGSSSWRCVVRQPMKCRLSRSSLPWRKLRDSSSRGPSATRQHARDRGWTR